MISSKPPLGPSFRGRGAVFSMKSSAGSISNEGFVARNKFSVDFSEKYFQCIYIHTYILLFSILYKLCI